MLFDWTTVISLIFRGDQMTPPTLSKMLFDWTTVNSLIFRGDQMTPPTLS